jgi:hypothetical protein
MPKSTYHNAHERLMLMRILGSNVKSGNHSAYYHSTYEEIGKELGVSKQDAEQITLEAGWKFRQEFIRRFFANFFDTEVGFGKTKLDTP